MSTDVEKSRFLEEFGDDYGYPNAPKNIDEIRATEFNRLQGNKLLLFIFVYFNEYRKYKSIVFVILYVVVYILINSGTDCMQSWFIWIMLEPLYTLSRNWKQFSSLLTLLFLAIPVSHKFMLITVNLFIFIPGGLLPPPELYTIGHGLRHHFNVKFLFRKKKILIISYGTMFYRSIKMCVKQ